MRIWRHVRDALLKLDHAIDRDYYPTRRLWPATTGQTCAVLSMTAGDLAISALPCTDLAVSGARHYLFL